MSEALTFSDLVPNATLGHYTLVEHIADGGMGHVFRAFEPSLQREVAIKVLKSEFVQDERILKQFEMEAQNIAALRHPNIVPIYFVGHQGELYFFAMPFIVGQTLDTFVENEDIMTLDEAKWIIYQASDALERALAQNIVHLDIKPSNFLIDESGMILLTDFGLAKVLGQNSDLHSEESFCTPAYMCPEQILRDATDQRSDIYCLGATIYHLITGRFLYESDSITELVKAHLHEPFPFERAEELGLPPGWIHLLSKMLCKDPKERYQNYQELRADVDNVEHLAPVNRFSADEIGEAPSGPIHVPVQRSAPESLHGFLGRKNLPWMQGAVEKTISKPKAEIFDKIKRLPVLKIDKYVDDLKEISGVSSLDMSDLVEAVSLIPHVDEYVTALGQSELVVGEKHIETRRQALRQVGADLSGQILMTGAMLQKLTKDEEEFVWRPYWQQSVATGVIAHILLRLLKGAYLPGRGNIDLQKKTSLVSTFRKSELDKAESPLFLAALCHGIGKIVLAEIAPYPFFVAMHEAQAVSGFLSDQEFKIFSTDHREVGAMWLKVKGFDAAISSSALNYNSPEFNTDVVPALVCVASHVVRMFGIGFGGDPVMSVRDIWSTPAWEYLVAESKLVALTPEYMNQEFVPLVGTLPHFEV